MQQQSFGKIGLAVTKIKTIAVDLDPADREKVLAMIKDVKGNTAQIDLTKVPKRFIELCIEKLDLSKQQRKTMFVFITGDGEKLLAVKLSGPKDLHNVITSLSQAGEANAEMQLNGRWYPVALSSQYHPPMMGDSGCTQVNANVSWVGGSYNFSWYVHAGHFSDDAGNKVELLTGQIFELLELRTLQTDMMEYTRLMRQAEKFGSQDGKLALVTNSAFMIGQHWFMRGIQVIPFGTEFAPRRVVIESQLEQQNTNDMYTWRRSRNNSSVSEIPVIRVFSLERKEYIFVDIRDVEEYKFDEKAIDRLVLPTEINGVLRKVFDAGAHQLFGDVLKGKHGGMVILAHGGPGVGKTLTAEVFAEHTKRPLYVMELGELGTNLAEVEKSLQRIFARATRWNAVLLMDEADVFMAERNADLERSAIVGVFLRLLDYYPGLLFLTTNRLKVIDPAFASRITLTLHYPDLTPDVRRVIWTTMLQLAGMKVTDGLNGIPNVGLDGRRIRNLVRLVKVTHGTQITHEELRSMCKYAVGFEQHQDKK